jgi:hypothetical protein
VAGKTFNVIESDCTQQIFQQSDKGLLFLDTEYDNDSKVALINIEGNNQYKYSN